MSIETDRKPWGCLTEKEVKKIRKKNCNGCKFSCREEEMMIGCNYSEITGRCRMCDPRDCRKLGFYKKGARIKRRLNVSGHTEIIEGGL